jgi:beta-galactosidase
MPPRERLLMDKDWRFQLGDIHMPDCRHVWSKVRTASSGPVSPGYDDSRWRRLDLPHDFVVEGGFSRDSRTVEDNWPLPMTDTEETAAASHGYLPASVGWYRKRFKLSKRDSLKRIWLVFDGLYRDARFWLNGLYLDRHQSGYTECRIDVTDLLVYGNERATGNVLVVRVDARQSEGWFYEGGGIYRHVWMEKTDPVAVAPHGAFVWTRKLKGKGASRVAELEVRTKIRNDTDDAVACRVVCRILDADGRTRAQSKGSLKLGAGAAAELIRPVTVRRPLLWGIEHPHLYTLVTEIVAGGKTVDRTETPFGIRAIRFDAERGFFLNGRNIKLKGVCVHQNHAGVGTAMPDRLFDYRIRQLKKLGCNAYRCAHYPHAPELLEACDRLGMLVMDETRSFSSAPEFMRQHESLLLRDRNHPSIIIYSMANEEGIQNTAVGERMMRSLRRLARRLDPSRPLTTANNDGKLWGKAVSKWLDVQGCNYCSEEYDRFHRKYPKQPMIATETSSRLTTRGIYRSDPGRGHVDAYDREVCDLVHGRMPAEAMWRGIAKRPYMSGAFVWTGIDYKGEPTPYRWPTVASHFGMLDSCCFPKDIAHFFKTWWGQSDRMHLFPHWNWEGREGEIIDVWCYARHETIELFLNGRSQGARRMPEMGHVSWKVPFEAGVLEARGFRDGEVVAVTRIETAGRAASIKLETDRAAIQADAEDVAVVNVSVVTVRAGQPRQPATPSHSK